jgi:thiol-disulfide isomerase/thioredoxin
MIRLLLLSAALACAQENWPAQLETDVATKHWEAAGRVGAAILDEIAAGRMFTRVSEIAAEIKVRTLYADALDHLGKSEEARHQRTLAGLLAERKTAPELAAETARRLANLKADVLATEIRDPASFPPSAPQVLIVAFWADWCALCKPELEQLDRYRNPRAKILKLDADHLDPALRRYLPIPSLESADLPQLYVVDPAGNIRFHTIGFEDDGYFALKLDWMLEAALAR